MNRLLQRFVADPSASSAGHAPPSAEHHSARDNPQLESLLAPPPRAAVAPGSSGARLYPLPPRSASYGYPAPAPRPVAAGNAPPRSSDGRFPPPPPAQAPPPVTSDHPAFFYYQHNPYQYQAHEFQRQQPHPPPPPSSSGSQRRGSGNALDAGVYEDIPLSAAPPPVVRSTYETVDLSDDARPLPGRVGVAQGPPRSTDGQAGAFFGAFQTPPPPRSTGNAAVASRPAATAFFQHQPQPQDQQKATDDDARSVSDLFAGSADLPPPQTPPLAPQTPSLHRNLSASDLFSAPALSSGASSSSLNASDVFASPSSNLSAQPTPAISNGSSGPRPLGIARSPVQKPSTRRLSSSSSSTSAPPQLSARQLAMHDRLRHHHQQHQAGGAGKAKAMSVDLDFERQRGRSHVTTRDDSAKLADMYKQMAERLQGEKQGLLKVVAAQADQIAALQRRVASLEQQQTGAGDKPVA